MVENVITSKLEIQGYENIKQIKDEITKLRAQMKELTSGTEEYKETADKLVQTEYQLKTAMSNARKDNSALKGSYNDLANQMSALKKVWKETTDSALRTSYGQQINELNTQLKGLDATTGNFQRNVGDYKNQLKLAKKELAQLTEGTEAYNKKLAECAEIQHNFTEQQTLIKNSSKDLGDQLANVTQIGAGLVGGFSALNAAMGLFGKETDDVQKAMLKVQQYMAIVQGLQGMEGMFKKAKQLSTALGWVKAVTVENTVATEAEATASVAAGAALETEAVATKGATAAQKGLNAAMKANPIGAILAVLIALGAAFVLFKDKIKDLVGWTDESSKKFEGFKAVISGIGSVVTKFLIKPIEDTINIFKTLGKTFKSVFKGDWQGAKDALKEGVENYADSWKNAIDVVGNYQEGAAQKRKELEEKRIREEAEARSKELDSYIKDNEAKYGSDYKYTEDGIKAYREMYETKKKMYAKDTEEYKQAQRDQWSYEQMLSERNKQKTEKEIEESNAKLKKIEDDFNNTIGNIVYNTREKAYNGVNKVVDIWNQGIKQIDPSLEIKLSPPSEMDLLDEIEKPLSKLRKALEPVIGEPLSQAMKESADDAVEIRERLVDNLIRDVFKELYDAELTYFTNSETALKIHEDKVAAVFEKERQAGRVDFQREATYETAILENRIAKLTENNTKLSNLYKTLKENNVASDASMYKDLEQLGQKYATEITKLENKLAATKSDINKRYVQDLIEQNEKAASDLTHKMETQLKKDQAKNGTLDYWFGGFTGPEMQKKAKEVTDEIYNTQKASLQAIADTLNQEINSGKYVNDDLIELTKQRDEVLMSLYDTEANYYIKKQEEKLEANKRWADGIKDTFNGLSDIYGKSADAYKMMIDQKVKDDDMSNEEAEKQYKVVQNLQAAQAIVNTLAASMGAYQSLASIPYVGPALGAAAAATTLAYGYAQVKQIRSTNPYSNSSSIDTGVNAASTPTIDEYSPNRVSNITGAMETENLKNALQSTPLWVSVQDINSVQNQVKVKDRETSF